MTGLARELPTVLQLELMTKAKSLIIKRIKMTSLIITKMKKKSPTKGMKKFLITEKTTKRKKLILIRMILLTSHLSWKSSSSYSKR